MNTSINIIGGIPDYNLIIQGILNNSNSIAKQELQFKFRTDKALQRFNRAIRDAFLKFSNKQQHELFFSFINSENSYKDKLIVLFWQFLINNNLFRLIAENVYFNSYYAGRSILKAEEILAYLQYVKPDHNDLKTWSDNTLKTVASKYLTCLKKFDLLEGGVNKEIKHIYLNNELFVYFIRLIFILDPVKSVTDNKYIRYGLASTDTIMERVKKREFEKYWNISFVGNNIKLELK